MKIIAILSLLALINCVGNTEWVPSSSEQSTPEQEAIVEINYVEFEPEKMTDFTHDNFQVESAFKLDSCYILSAYADGDIATSEKPTNWGDRLVLYKNEQIRFQSKPVGDVYLYEPHFYKNDLNDKTIIICQLGYEYFFGGEVFMYENGELTFMGAIEVEAEKEELRMTEMIQITEQAEMINFYFDSEQLIFKPGDKDSLIENNNFHYRYKAQSWTLNGL